jgi:hypothetical protein
VAVFKGDGLFIMCVTFLGTEEDAPKNATVSFEPEKRMTFYTFSRDGIHAVLHREDSVICMLVSNMPPEELLSLVKSSSPHSHRQGHAA